MEIYFVNLFNEISKGENYIFNDNKNFNDYFSLKYINTAKTENNIQEEISKFLIKRD